MRASAVLKCQSTLQRRLLRSSIQRWIAVASDLRFAILRDCADVTTRSSISAKFSHLPYLGVWWISNRSAIRLASSGGNAS